MDPITLTVVGWLVQPAAGTLFAVAKEYLSQSLGLSPSRSAASNIKPLLDEYLQHLTERLDEDRIAKLHGALSKLKDASRSVARQGLLIEALDSFHEIVQIPQQGTTRGRPNAELRCMAFVGMAATYNLLRDQPELIAEKMVEAVRADADAAKQWLGENLVREIILQFPSLAPGITCPKCGFRNSPGARFCNQDGYPLPTDQATPDQKMGELTGAIVQTFRPVWYYPVKDVRLLVVVQEMVQDTGALIVRDNLLEFQGAKKSVQITHVKEISMVWIPSPCIKVIYGDDSVPSTAFFADAGGFGYRGFLGGAKLIMETLQKTYLSGSIHK
jgi:hypothetical protein